MAGERHGNDKLCVNGPLLFVTLAPERQRYASVRSCNIKDVGVKKAREFTKYEMNREDIEWDTK